MPDSLLTIGNPHATHDQLHKIIWHNQYISLDVDSVRRAYPDIVSILSQYSIENMPSITNDGYINYRNKYNKRSTNDLRNYNILRNCRYNIETIDEILKLGKVYDDTYIAYIHNNQYTNDVRIGRIFNVLPCINCKLNFEVEDLQLHRSLVDCGAMTTAMYKEWVGKAIDVYYATGFKESMLLIDYLRSLTNVNGE